MPSPAGALFKLAVKAWPEIVKNGPKVVVAVGALSKFLKDNPTVPNWLRQRLDEVPKRLVNVQKRRGEGAKIRGNLDIVRDVARDAEKADPATLEAMPYVARADALERGVRLAEALARPEQKTALERLKTDTDALLADLLDAVARVQAPSPSDAAETLTQTYPAEQPPQDARG